MSTTNNRQPPHDVEVERALLGSMFLSPEAVELVLGIVRRDDFYRPAHGRVFEAMEYLRDRAAPIDQLSVADCLDFAGHLEAVGGRGYLLDLASAVPTTANVAHYAGVVRRLAALRALAVVGSAITTLALDEDDAARAVERAHEMLAPIGKHIAPAGPTGVLLQDVQSKRVTWLWPGRIPRGKLCILDGDPGLGKSTLALELAARVSVGDAMPGCTSGQQEPAGAVLLSAEDDLGDTIRPRLDAACADVSRIVALRMVPGIDGERPPVLPDDLHQLRAAIERVDAVLVVIDPLMAYLNGKTDAHRDQDVRTVLHRLARLAEETDAAVVCIRHLNKTSGVNPLYRGGGSIGIIGAARAGLIVARDPDDESRRVLASTKNNLSAESESASLAFHLETASNGSCRLVWQGPCDHSAADLLAVSANPEDRTVLGEAKDFIRDILAIGPVRATEVQAQAREGDISKRTLQRAKTDLGVESHRTNDAWWWALPAKVANDSPANGDGQRCQSWQSCESSHFNDADTASSLDSVDPSVPRVPSLGVGNLGDVDC